MRPRSSCTVSVNCGVQVSSRSRGRLNSNSRRTRMRLGLRLITSSVSVRNALSSRSRVTRITLKCCAACRSRNAHRSASRVKASCAPHGREQQHLQLVDQRAAETGALLHAARPLPREFVFTAAGADALQQLARLLGVLGIARAEPVAVGFDDLERQQHVVDGGAPRQQARRLKRHVADLERTGHRLPVDADAAAAAAGRLQASGKFHEGRPSAARRTDEGDELAGCACNETASTATC